MKSLLVIILFRSINNAIQTRVEKLKTRANNFSLIEPVADKFVVCQDDISFITPFFFESISRRARRRYITYRLIKSNELKGRYGEAEIS